MPEVRLDMTDEMFRLIRSVLNEYCGMDFAEDRSSMVASRLGPRAAALGCGSFLDYYRVLKYEGEDELPRAVEALTNNETYFFREVAQLRMLTSLALSSRQPFRVLSAGCSTGEEPYTLAMLMRESGLLRPHVDIVAADIDTTALDRARAAVYGRNSFRGIDDVYLEKYFFGDGTALGVRPSICGMVRFERANLLDRDEIERLGTFHAVLCRNVMIYFDRESVQAAITNLTSVLHEGGFLFLGHAESLHDVPAKLEMVRMESVIAYRRPVSAQVSLPTVGEVDSRGARSA